MEQHAQHFAYLFLNPFKKRWEDAKPIRSDFKAEINKTLPDPMLVCTYFRQFLESIDPKDLVMSVAEGADAACNAYHSVIGSGTNNSIGSVLNSSQRVANEMVVPWQIFYDAVHSVSIPRLAGSIALEGIKMAVRGVTFEQAIGKLAWEFFSPTHLLRAVRSVHESAQNSTLLLSLHEKLSITVYDGFTDQILPNFVNDLRHN
jgi:hypothetical protein